MARALIYARISDDREGLAAGVTRQEDDCRTFCDARGWDVAGVYVDNGVSAYHRRPRPAYERAYDALKAGDADVLVVWHLDRLYRHPLELEQIIDLVEATGLTVATVTGGDYDLTTTDGRAMARVVVTFARKESEDKSRRTKRKHLELAQQGRAVGGRRAFGYEDDKVTVRPAEAELVREAAGRVLAGESVRGICTDFNSRGIASAGGSRWTMNRLKRVLTNYRTAGIRALADVPVAPATWEGILDEVTHRRLRALLLDPARRTNGNARSYLLSGFLVCWQCEKRLMSRRGRNRARTYVCASGPERAGCGGLRVVAEPIEEMMAGALFERLDSPELARAVANAGARDDSDDLVAAIAGDEARLEQLARDHYVDEVIGRAQFLTASRQLEGRIEATRRRLTARQATTAASPWVGRGDVLAAAWEDMTFDRKRAVMLAVVESVTIGPAVRGLGRFDPARVGTPHWRI